jgi:hypothetical protein
MSPGLYRSDVPLRKQYLPRQLVYDLLSLKGLAPGGTWHPNTPPELRDASLHPDAVTLGAVSCQDGWCNSEAKCDAQPTCGLCHRCRTQEQDGILSNLVAEHKGGAPPGTHCLNIHSSTVHLRTDHGVLLVGWLVAPCLSHLASKQAGSTLFSRMHDCTCPCFK